VAYREFEPPPELRPFVACVWTGTTSGEGAAVLPDGCVDVVWTGAELVVAGPATEVVRPRLRPGLQKLGVRFRVGAAGAALALPAHELLDATVPLAEVWGRRAERIAETVTAAPTPARALEALTRGVAERLPDPSRIDRLVRSAALLGARFGSSVAERSGTLAISERQLLRRFREAVGYGPSTLARVLRFQRFLWLAELSPAEGPDLARLAFDAGYADQAHLTRECRRLAAATPATLVGRGARAAGERSDAFKTVSPEPVRLAA
jgi:AraC-like DNA-binding protein